MEIILGVPRNSEKKIVTANEAKELIAKWQQQGRKIVFTNGCFDILHKGHVQYLAAARKLGDALIIGLNSDASIKRLKGNLRPILPLEERAAILASLECVDLIVIFEEDDPGKLIATLKPKILVKGADWSENKIIGSDTIKALGGEVLTLPLVSGCSTTNVINTILERYGK